MELVGWLVGWLLVSQSVSQLVIVSVDYSMVDRKAKVVCNLHREYLLCTSEETWLVLKE